MSSKIKAILLKFGIPSLAVIVIAIQLFFVNTQNLSKWKGGGFGMYTSIHFYYNQIYITDMSVDSLITENRDIKNAFRDLTIMPNDDNFKKAAEVVLKSTKKDSIHIQIWRPDVNSITGDYSRALINEIHLTNSEL